MSCHWKTPFSAWSETSFDLVRDFSQPPPPGVDFVNTYSVPYQQYNVSTRLPVSQIPHATTYTPQQSYASCIGNDETTNNITFQPGYFSSPSSENYCDPKSKKLRRRKEKKKKVVVNDNKLKKEKNASDGDEIESIIQIKREAVQKFYEEKTSIELKTKPIEIAKKEHCDHCPKNGEPTCVAMKLPLEIFVIIVEYSTAETTLALTFTCQKWYNWLTDGKSAYINRAWRRSRKNTHPRRRKPKTGICEMNYTIQKMNPKPEWYLECDMCYKKSNIMKWKFNNNLVKTCYNCKKMYELPNKQTSNKETKNFK